MVKFLRIKVLKYLAGFSDLQLGIYDSEFQTSKGAWTLKAFAESASAIRDTYNRLNNVSDLTYYKELFDLRKNSTKELWANLNKVCSFKKIRGSSNGIKK